MGLAHSCVVVSPLPPTDQHCNVLYIRQPTPDLGEEDRGFVMETERVSKQGTIRMNQSLSSTEAYIAGAFSEVLMD